MTKKVTGYNSSMKKAIFRHDESDADREVRESSKRDSIINAYGEPDYVFCKAGHTDYYWFVAKIVLKEGTMSEIEIKKKYWLFGKEEIYIKVSYAYESEHLELDVFEVQLAYQWHKAEQLILEIQ